MSPLIVAGLKAISGQIDRGRNFEALKALRSLFPLEEKEMYPERQAGQGVGGRLKGTTMSSVPPTSSASSTRGFLGAAASARSATNSLSYNDFLTMLLAEMKNQDPTQPMDPTAMVSQLATISQVGQAVQTNTTLASLLTRRN